MLARGIARGALHRLARVTPSSYLVSRGVVSVASVARRALPTQFAFSSTADGAIGPRHIRWLSSARDRPTRTRLRGRPAFANALVTSANENDTVDCIRISRLDRADVGALEDVLLSLGATCCVVEDADAGTAEEKEVFAGDTKSWHTCDVTVMFAQGADIEGIMRNTMEILCATFSYKTETIAGDAWVGVVLRSFKNVEVADGLWIVKQGTEPEDLDKDSINVILEPSLAFGSGEHPTTRLCLKWLVEEKLSGKSVLDFGTGSGVLAIGALLMGAKSAAGVDNELVSVEAAMRNSRLNNVDTKMQTYLADGTPNGGALPPGLKKGEPKFDVVVANILLGPVLALAPLFAEFCTPKGRVCLSGVLTTQTPQVLLACAPFFDDLRVETENEWAVVFGTRKE